MSQAHVSSICYPSVAFCGTLDICCIVDFVVSAVDCICSHGPRHRQFRIFIDETEAEYPPPPMFRMGLRVEGQVRVVC
jgi:hypothetical protein